MYSGEMLFWDGTDESGNMVSFDLYLVLITGFSPKWGERYDKKMAVAVDPSKIAKELGWYPETDFWKRGIKKKL